MFSSEGLVTDMKLQCPGDAKLGDGEAEHVGADEPRKPFTVLLSVTQADDEEIASFQGFHSPWWKKLLYYFVGVITAGFSFLVCKWSPRLHILLSLSPCSLKQAQYVRIRLTDGRVDLERVVEVVLPEQEQQLDSQPTFTLDEEEAGRGGLLDWQAQRVHRLLEYRCTRYFYLEGAEGAAAAAGAAGAGPAGAAACGGGGGGGQGGTFVPVPHLPAGFAAQLQAAAAALAATGQASAAEAEAEWDLAERQLRYGTNEMTIPVKSIPTLVFEEMWHPFYVFQYFSILIWIVGDQYYSYSVCIAVITWFSIISAAVEAYQNMRRLADIAHFECEVEVLREGRVHRLPSSALVPGDLLLLAPGTLPCDCVLLRGECILDENMLTGESVPVRKVPYNPVADGLAYQPDKCPGCTLFGGTVVAQARAPRHQRPLAMVCRTRFYSAKGQLLRSILFPREHEESFISDSLRFIAVMLACCMGLYIWAAVVLASVGASADRIVVRFFDMITIAVPPALPACLTIATVFSIGRLRRKGVYVTSPDRITLAGQLDVIAFDKTGTLTEQGLDLQGIVPVVGGRLHNLVPSCALLPLQLVELLASCHGLARCGEALVGDPLDQKLFLATHWDLIDEHHAPRPGEPAADGHHPGAGGDGASVADIDGAVGGGAADAAEAAAEATGTEVGGVHTYVRPPGAANAYAIIKRFEFSAALQRNLVVVRAPDGSTAVFAKGSPEAIRALVSPASVPPDFDSLLGELTREGLRVLALAAGDAGGVPEGELLGWTQGQTEAGVGLALVGLAVMANPLRPDTADVVARLQHASIRTVMVTGDHVRTAISVAHQCSILPAQRPILLVDAADAPAPPQLPPQCPDQQQQVADPQLLPPSQHQAPALLANGTAEQPLYQQQLQAQMQLQAHAAPMPVGPGRGWAAAAAATGPGPAGEPTPLGDPSIQYGYAAGGLLCEEADQGSLAGSTPLGSAGMMGNGVGFGMGSAGTPPSVLLAGSAGSGGGALSLDGGGYSPPAPVPSLAAVAVGAAAQVEDAAVHARRAGAAGLAGDPKAAAQLAATANGGQLSSAPSAPGGGASLGPLDGLRLSVLDVEGNVGEMTSVNAGGGGGSGAGALMARVLTGELECAVTGKGFSALLAAAADAAPSVAAAAPGRAAATTAASLLLPVLQRTAVFARMSPDNKRDLMLLLGAGLEGGSGGGASEGGGAGGKGGGGGVPHLGLRAGFCGDGANDCGALKAAHVGVSLCEAEASVAAPMTSKAQTIASMITVVAEGRCTLMATYQIFQFIIAYALVQAFETNLMYTYALNLGNYQYLIEDLFFTTVLAALMGFTEPRGKLSRSRPLSRVMSLPLLLSTVAQCCVVVLFQLAGLALLAAQPGYTRFRGGPELHDTVAPENTVTYIIALAQFIVLALVFNKGMPHRSPIWTNRWLLAALAAQICFVLYTLFSTDRFNREVQQLVGRDGVMDTAFRWKLLGLLAAMCATAFAAEYACVGLLKLLAWARAGGGGGGRRGSVPVTVVDAVRMDRR